MQQKGKQRPEPGTDNPCDHIARYILIILIILNCSTTGRQNRRHVKYKVAVRPATL